MPSSYTASLRFEKQFTGENVNTWGDRLNALFDRADFAVAGMSVIALTGDHSLSASNTADDQARAAHLKFTGGAGPFTVTIPSVSKSYRVWNASAGVVTLTTGAGTTVVVDPGDVVDVMCDGANARAPGYGGLSIKDYIASVAFDATGQLPAAAGHAGKYIYSNGANWAPRTPAVADLSDYASDQASKAADAFASATALAVAFATAL